MALSKAVEEKSKAVISASTGNTSASAAAYAAQAGIRCVVLIPDGNIALGKLSQGLMHGAEVYAVEGNFDDALQMVVRVVETGGITHAAESLRIPKATATTLIQKLEAALGVKLLNRTTRRVSVTPDGAAYYERCVAILADAMRTGRLLPSDPGEVDWRDADWYLLRLAAVCAVALDSDCF